jgi:hypothetical protein
MCVFVRKDSRGSRRGRQGKDWMTRYMDMRRKMESWERRLYADVFWVVRKTDCCYAENVLASFRDSARVSATPRALFYPGALRISCCLILPSRDWNR